MCGIVGCFKADGVDISSSSLLGSIAHRGPDDSGFYFSNDGKIWLGHTRLSILDLSEKAAQPMQSPDGRYVLTFNGEIYNFLDLKVSLLALGHVFQSTSDTEVLLKAWQAWGTDCLPRLKGMFAFAIYDQALQTITLARDIAGEKPLYYKQDELGFSFSSELWPMLTNSKPSLDAVGLNQFLAKGYTDHNHTILDGCKKLEAGNLLTFDIATQNAVIDPYWYLPTYEPATLRSDVNLLEEMETLLKKAISEQLVADVPVGVLLSGGLDSSLITALAAKEKEGLNTYTVIFPGYDAGNEVEHARKISKYFGTRHHEIEAGSISPGLFLSLVHKMEHPIADPAFLPTYLLSEVIKKHCTVALGGDGADEVFGGYTRYTQWLAMQKQGQWLPLALRKLVRLAAKGLLPEGFRGRHYLEQLGTDFGSSLPLEDALFSEHNRQSLLKEGYWQRGQNAWKGQNIPEGYDFLDRSLRYDFNYFMRENILIKVDRASMLASLEVRAPFLDKAVVEFAFSKIPSRQKAEGNGRKILLRQLARKHLPDDFDFERKQGFVPPLELWFADQEWIDFIEVELLDNLHPIFNQKFIQKLWRGQQKGRFNKRRIYTLLVLSIWLKHHKIAHP